MPNLKKFKLNLCCSDKIPYCWDEGFPFAELINLKELRIILHKDMKTLPWGKYMVKNISNLNNLEVLEIIEENKQAINFDMLYGLITRLELENLRIVLYTKVVRVEPYSEYLQNFWEEQRRKDEEAIFEKIRANVTRAMSQKLEEINIREIRDYAYGTIIYKK